MAPARFSARSHMGYGRKIVIWMIAIWLCLPFGAAAATAEETEEVFLNNAAGAMLVEANTLQVIDQNGADELRGVAGLSKLPGILVLCEAVDQGKLDLNADISVSQRAAGVPGPTAFIESGEVIKAEPLLKAAIMIGAGDAVVALGENAYGSETAFMEQIEARLRELQLDVKLQDAVGKDARMSPRMLASLGAALMKSPSFTAYSGMTLDSIDHSDGRQTELANANKMLRSYAGCTGVMTGSSAADGYGGVFSVVRGDTHLICVVLGCTQSSERFALASEMLDQAFATTRAQKLAEKGEIIAEDVRVKGAKMRTTDLVAKDTVVLLLEKSQPSLLAVEDIPSELRAPLAAGEVVGSISYQTAEGVEKGRVELVCEQDIEAHGFRDLLRQILLGFLRG